MTIVKINTCKGFIVFLTYLSFAGMYLIENTKATENKIGKIFLQSNS